MCPTGVNQLIRTTVEDFDNYDIVYIGYPVWYGSMAPMQTFLHEHAAKLTGKRIALFATSSSGISTSLSEARALCPDATFTETLLLTSSTLPQADSRVTAWLGQLGADREEHSDDNTSVKMNITVGDRTVTATMEDNAAAQDFLSHLPLEVTLNDYNNTTEKIFYPSPALTTEGVTRGCAPVPGDITIYIPWGNVAVFCKNWLQSNDLIKIGHIDGDGIEAFIPMDFLTASTIIAPDVVHWHGAAPDSWFSHIAVEYNPQTNKNTWFEPVDDEAYAKAVK